MISSLVILLLNFVASHASGILTGVVGTKLTAWLGSHVKTKAEKAVYTDIVLPLIQSFAGLLQGVNLDQTGTSATTAVTVTPNSVTATTTPSSTNAATIRPAAVTGTPVYND